MTAPTPIPAGSPKLRNYRWEATAHGPKNERGAYPMIGEEGRFLTLDDAKAWADEVYPDAFLIAVDYLSASSGWEITNGASRRGGSWDR